MNSNINTDSQIDGQDLDLDQQQQVDQMQNLGFQEVEQLNKKRAYRCSLSTVHEENETLLLDKTLINQMLCSSDKKQPNKSVLLDQSMNQGGNIFNLEQIKESNSVKKRRQSRKSNSNVYQTEVFEVPINMEETKEEVKEDKKIKSKGGRPRKKPQQSTITDMLSSTQNDDAQSVGSQQTKKPRKPRKPKITNEEEKAPRQTKKQTQKAQNANSLRIYQQSSQAIKSIMNENSDTFNKTQKIKERMTEIDKAIAELIFEKRKCKEAQNDLQKLAFKEHPLSFQEDQNELYENYQEQDKSNQDQIEYWDYQKNSKIVPINYSKLTEVKQKIDESIHLYKEIEKEILNYYSPGPQLPYTEEDNKHDKQYEVDASKDKSEPYYNQSELQEILLQSGILEMAEITPVKQKNEIMSEIDLNSIKDQLYSDSSNQQSLKKLCSSNKKEENEYQKSGEGRGLQTPQVMMKSDQLINEDKSEGQAIIDNQFEQCMSFFDKRENNKTDLNQKVELSNRNETSKGIKDQNQVQSLAITSTMSQTAAARETKIISQTDNQSKKQRKRTKKRKLPLKLKVNNYATKPIKKEDFPSTDDEIIDLQKINDQIQEFQINDGDDAGLLVERSEFQLMQQPNKPPFAYSQQVSGFSKGRDFQSKKRSCLNTPLRIGGEDKNGDIQEKVTYLENYGIKTRGLGKNTMERLYKEMQEYLIKGTIPGYLSQTEHQQII